MICARHLLGFAFICLATSGCGKADPSVAADRKAILAEANQFAADQAGGNEEVELQLSAIKKSIIQSSQASPKASNQEKLTPGLIDFVATAVVNNISFLVKSENTKMANEISEQAADFFSYEEF